jgi:serine/threonine-protein kinase RsbW
MSRHSNGHRRLHRLPPGGFITSRDPPWVSEPVHDIRQPLHLTGTATRQDATRLRHRLRTWLAPDVPAELIDDVVLAVYEAIANATEHAYADHPDSPGPIHLTARRSPDHVWITVTDHGRWQAATGDPTRSRGLPLMRHLVRDLHITPGDNGTIVHLRTSTRTGP